MPPLLKYPPPPHPPVFPPLPLYRKKQDAVRARRAELAAAAALAAPELPALDAKIVDAGDADILRPECAPASLKMLGKRFNVCMKKLAELEGAATSLAGGDALVQEIGVVRGELDARIAQWAKWRTVPLPGGGVGLASPDAVKKLWVLASDAKECYVAFEVRVKELQVVVFGGGAGKKRRGGAASAVARKGGAGAGASVGGRKRPFLEVLGTLASSKQSGKRKHAVAEPVKPRRHKRRKGNARPGASSVAAELNAMSDEEGEEGEEGEGGKKV